MRTIEEIITRKMFRSSGWKRSMECPQQRKKKKPFQDKLNTRYVLSVKASRKDTDKTKYVVLRTGRPESDITGAFLLR